MKKLLFIIGVFASLAGAPSVVFSANVYDNGVATSTPLVTFGTPSFMAYSSPSFNQNLTTVFKILSVPVTDMLVKDNLGTCAYASALQLHNGFVNITASSTSIDGGYCKLHYSSTIPAGTSLYYVAYPGSGPASFYSSEIDGFTRNDANTSTSTTAIWFKLCSDNDCSGEYLGEQIPPSISLDFPTATSTMSGFNNWVTTWENASTSYSQPVIYYSASSTLLNDCKIGFEGYNAGSSGLYYCPYGTSTNKIYRDFGPQYGNLNTFTNTISKSEILEPNTYYVFAGLDDYSIGYGIAVSPTQQFIINATSSYTYNSTSTATTTPEGIANILNFDCISDNAWFGYIYEGTCKAFKYLFIPDGPTIATYWEYAVDRITTSFPLGYITDFVTIMSTTTVGTLTIIDATIPNGIAGAGANIHLDLNGVLDQFLYATTSQFINSSASDTRSFYDITSEYWEKIIWFLFAIYIIGRILGSGIIPLHWSDTSGIYAENIRARNRDIRYHNAKFYDKNRKI